MLNLLALIQPRRGNISKATSHIGSATDSKHLPVHPSTVLAAQEGNDSGYIFRHADAFEILYKLNYVLAPNLERMRKNIYFIDLLISHGRLVGNILPGCFNTHIHLDPPRRDSIDGNIPTS